MMNIKNDRSESASTTVNMQNRHDNAQYQHRIRISQQQQQQQQQQQHPRHQHQQQRDVSNSNSGAIGMGDFLRAPPPHWYRGPFNHNHNHHQQGFGLPLNGPYQRSTDHLVSGTTQIYRNSINETNGKVSAPFSDPSTASNLNPVSVHSTSETAKRSRSNDSMSSRGPHPASGHSHTHVFVDTVSSGNNRNGTPSSAMAMPANGQSSRKSGSIVRASVHSIPVINNVTAPGHPHHHQALLDITNQGHDPNQMYVTKVSSKSKDLASSNGKNGALKMDGKNASVHDDSLSLAFKINTKRPGDDLYSVSTESSCSPPIAPFAQSSMHGMHSHLKRQRNSSNSLVPSFGKTPAVNQPPRGMLDLLCEAATIVTDCNHVDNSRSTLILPPVAAITDHMQRLQSTLHAPAPATSIVSDCTEKAHNISHAPALATSIATNRTERAHNTPHAPAQATFIVTNRMEKAHNAFHSSAQATSIVTNRTEKAHNTPHPPAQATSIVTNHMEKAIDTAQAALDLKIHRIENRNIATKSNQESKRHRKQDKGCNCPRSRCIKLYCECFQLGNYCSSHCKCQKCQNDSLHDGPRGPRTLAIQNILSRNPYAFHKDKLLLEKKNSIAAGVNCRCVKSRCLKLYCDCFQSGKLCGESCLCIKCLNTAKESSDTGRRTTARSLALMKNLDAFKKKVKEAGAGCSCKNSKCLKKYCDCFNNGLACSSKCSCRDCQNLAPGSLKVKGVKKATPLRAASSLMNGIN